MNNTTTTADLSTETLCETDDLGPIACCEYPSAYTASGALDAE